MSAALNMTLEALAPWFGVILQAAIAIVLVLIVHRVGAIVLRRIAGSRDLPATVVRHAMRPSRWLLVILALQFVLRVMVDPLGELAGLRQSVSVALIITLSWLAISAVRAVSEVIIRMHPADVADNLYARGVRTQTHVLARSVMGLIALLGLAGALMTFPEVRQFGASLLASAGVAGLVVGFAAKPVLGNLLAGLQIAMTQPIRLDDVVIVEGEWGRIEEITGSYVVVRIWDERRLIVPLQWFIEHPFQNWTRTGSEILGTVILWVDYTTPLEPLRAETKRLCEAAPEWDGRLCLVQVTDSNERAMQLRVLVSAAESGRSWDLRCKVREGLIAYIQKEYPQHLPHIRGELTGTGRPDLSGC